MVMQAMHSGKGSKVIKLFFFALLVLAAGGLVLTDVGGFFSGGVSNTDVAKIGNKTIPASTFDRSVRRTLARANIPPQQAYQMGYINRILATDIRRNAFGQIAADYGISIGRDVVAKQISAMISPQIMPGQDKQQAFEMLLRQQGFTEPEFVRIVASEGAINLLAHAAQNKYLGASDQLALDLYQFQNESRDIEFITFLNSDYKKIEQPGNEQLLKMYEATKERFAIPEKRDITVAIIEDKALKSSIEITEEQIRGIYDDEIESFTLPEQRELEQAILTSESEAQKIADAVKAGTSLKQAVNTVTGKEESYLPAQNFQKDGLIEDIAEQVFSTKETGEVFGPVESPLGWHVLVLQDIKPPYTKPYDSVKDIIKKEILQNEFADQKYQIAGEIDDMLAGGASLEEVKETFPLTMTPVKGVNRSGAMGATTHPLDQFGEDAALITQLSFESFEGESAPVTELDDGRTAIVHVDKVIEKSYKPFEEVKEEIRKRWVSDHKQAGNTDFVKEILMNARAEGTSLDNLAEKQDKDLLTAKALKRNEEIKSPMTQVSIDQLFAADLNDLILFEIENGYAIGQVTASRFPDITQAKDNIVDLLKQAAIQDAGNESLTMFYEQKAKNIDIQVNEHVITRMYGPSDDNM